MSLTRRLAGSTCAVLVFASWASAQHPAPGTTERPTARTPRTLLAIFAHPDDEATVS
jgi:hypothetical protein